MLLPKQNRKDMVEIPKRVKRDLTFVFVERMEEVLPVALLPEGQLEPVLEGAGLRPASSRPN